MSMVEISRWSLPRFKRIFPSVARTRSHQGDYMGEIGDKNLSILINESRDVSVKEQIAVMLSLVVLSCY